MSSKNLFLRKTWIALAITIASILATVLLVSLPASQFAGAVSREYVAGIARLILVLAVGFVILQRQWGRNVLDRPTPWAWAIIAPVAAYSLVVYPLLFTGTLRLNLSQPNLAAGVAFNGFAAGAFEEFVFRGLILSLLLTVDSNDYDPMSMWPAIIISSVLFSVPHALNLFVGHAELRVVAQLIWAFLLGIVFACLRLSGRSIWPVAVLHGGLNAFVHVNRLGVEIEPSLVGAAALACAPLPLCVYGAILLQKHRLDQN